MTVDPRYPLGRFTFEGPATAGERAERIERLAAAPARLRAALEGLGEEQLETPYRDGGWTARQVAHHVPDSHLNAVLRLRLALTEDRPRIVAYDEDRWAALSDARTLPVDVSLRLLEALHERWVALWRALPAEAFARELVHPDSPEPWTVDRLLAVYAWHGHHHAAQVEHLRQRRGWPRAPVLR